MLSRSIQRNAEAVRLAGIFVAAFTVRWVAIDRSFTEQFFFGKYVALGRELWESGLVATRPFSYSPIYTYFMAVARGLFGDELYPVLLVQAVIGSLSCLLIYRVASIWFGWRWALVAAGMACVYRSFVLYDVTLLSDSLGLALQLALLAVVCLPRPARWRIPAAGLLIGLSMLQRPSNLLLLPLALGWLAIQEEGRRNLLRNAAVLAGTTLLIVLPVVVQNQRLTGSPGITASNPGYIFYSSNNPSSYGFRYSPPELYARGAAFYEREALARGIPERLLADAEIATIISSAVAGRSMTLRESSRFYLKSGLAHMARYPTHYLGLLLQKSWLAVHRFEPHDVLPVFVRQTAVSAVAPLTFAAVAPLGLLGLWLSRRDWRRYLGAYALVLNQLVLLTLFYVVVRFRLPLEAMLMLLSVLTLRAAADVVRQRGAPRRIVGAVSLVALLVLTAWLPPEIANRARGRNLDLLLEDAQRNLRRRNVERAKQQLERIVREDREELPRVHRARRLLNELRDGRPAAAGYDPVASIATLEKKRSEQGLSLDETRFLGNLYLEQGRWELAAAALTEALARRPSPIVRYDLGRARLNAGNLQAARTELLLAVRDGLLLTTRGMQGCHLLSQIAEIQGDASSALRWMRQAARQTIFARWSPEDAETRAVERQIRSWPQYVDPGDPRELLPH